MRKSAILHGKPRVCIERVHVYLLPLMLRMVAALRFIGEIEGQDNKSMFNSYECQLLMLHTHPVFRVECVLLNIADRRNVWQKLISSVSDVNIVLLFSAFRSKDNSIRESKEKAKILFAKKYRKIILWVNFADMHLFSHSSRS